MAGKGEWEHGKESMGGKRRHIENNSFGYDDY